MNFPVASAKLQGYDPKQVDALFSRVSSQNENPEREIISSAVVAVAKFDLVLGGYKIPAVDEAIAKVADGVREGGGMKLYLAYLRDPDGNKLCALHRMP